MAKKTFKPASDIATTRTLIHEAIPLTGTVISGTYGSSDGTTNNLKNYSHGMFSSVYDYPYLSSSANHIIDITYAYSSTSALSSSTSTQNSKKISMHNTYYKYIDNVSGSTDTIGLLGITGSSGVPPMDSWVALSFSRLLVKDGIKPGSFSITVGTGSWANPFDEVLSTASDSGSNIVLADASASLTKGTFESNNGFTMGTIYRRYGPAGTYVYSGDGSDTGVGIIVYEPGILLLTSSLFDSTPEFNALRAGAGTGQALMGMTGSATGSAISASAESFLHRVSNISFNNTTEINSTLYFCRAASNEFNYTENPTAVSSGSLVVKNQASDNPKTYITTIGLYADDGTLMGVAKVSEPLKKDPTTELTLRVRLDY